MFGVYRRLVAPLMLRADAILVRPSCNAPLARREAPVTQLLGDARTSVGAFELCMNGADQRKHLSRCQPGAPQLASVLSGPVSADAHREHQAHQRQGIDLAWRIYPSVLDSTSFAKYVVAFLRSRSPCAAWHSRSVSPQ